PIENQSPGLIRDRFSIIRRYAARPDDAKPPNSLLSSIFFVFFVFLRGSTLSSARTAVLVVTTNPVRTTAMLVTPPGNEIEVLVVDVQHVDAARVRRVGMEHLPARVLIEDADAFPLRHFRILVPEVVEGLPCGYLFRRERRLIVDVEVRVERRQPLER